MKSNPFVSVIIPVYNGAKTLRQCLASVLSQDYKNYEVLIIDNCSSDETKDIIESFCREFNNVRYIFESFRSRGSSRNAGIRQAGGEIVAMTDCDCIVPAHWLRKLIEPISKESEGESVVMGTEEGTAKNFWSQNIQEEKRAFLERHRLGNYVKFLDTKNFAIKGELLRDLMFNDSMESLEDIEFSLRIKDRARIRFLPSLKVIHLDGTSFYSWIKINFNRGRAIQKIVNHYKTDVLILEEPMFQGTGIFNVLDLVRRFFISIVRRPLGKTLFLFISEASWRVGILCSERK